MAHLRSVSTSAARGHDAALEQARDRLAAALFERAQAERWADSPEHRRAVELRARSCEAWVALLERPVPLRR